MDERTVIDGICAGIEPPKRKHLCIKLSSGTILISGNNMKRQSLCNLDISALRALLVLREHGSFARVSEQIHLSSSAVFARFGNWRTNWARSCTSGVATYCS
jgi:hypothetical protein